MDLQFNGMPREPWESPLNTAPPPDCRYYFTCVARARHMSPADAPLTADEPEPEPERKPFVPK
jgi:hypothetical protein